MNIFSGLCLVGGLVATVAFFVNELYRPDVRAQWRQNHKDRREVARLITLGITPYRAQRIVEDIRDRESNAIDKAVRASEGLS